METVYEVSQIEQCVFWVTPITEGLSIKMIVKQKKKRFVIG